MSQFIIFNGQTHPAQSPVMTGSNRSYRYGDGFFETIRCRNGKPLWIEYHLARLRNSAAVLKMTLPDTMTDEALIDQIHQLLNFNNHLQGARLRMSVFREEGGNYNPVDNNAGYLLESFPLDNEMYTLNKTGLAAGVFPDLVKSCNVLSGLKSANALIYVMAYLYAGEKGWDEVILLNDSGYIAEAGSSNIFMIDDGLILTPSVDQACVDGVMRKVLLDVAAKHRHKILECAILPQDLLKADEIFTCNAITGIQWIKGINNKRYYHNFASEFLLLLNQESIEYFEDKN